MLRYIWWIGVLLLCHGEVLRHNDYTRNNLFDPLGHQRQLDFAENAILEHASPLCCFQVSNGIIFIGGRRSRNSRLVVSSAPKTVLYDDHRLLVAASGLAYDAASIFDTFRKIIHGHREYFPKLKYSVEELASVYSKTVYHSNDLFAEQAGADDDVTQFLRRIPGVNLLLAGISLGRDDHMPPQGRIFLIRPDGSRSQHRIVSQGRQSESMDYDLLRLLQQPQPQSQSQSTLEPSCSSSNSDVTVQEAFRRIKSSGFLRRYFLSSEQPPRNLEPDDSSSSSSSSSSIPTEPPHHQLQIWVMYTKLPRPVLDNGEETRKTKQVLGIWQSVDARSLLS